MRSFHDELGCFVVEGAWRVGEGRESTVLERLRPNEKKPPPLLGLDLPRRDDELVPVEELRVLEVDEAKVDSEVLEVRGSRGMGGAGARSAALGAEVEGRRA